MKKKLAILAAAAATSVLLSQTRPHTSQIRGPVTTDARVLAIVQGRIVIASLGSGLKAQQVGGGWVISAVAPQAPDDYEVTLSRNTDGSWALPEGCGLREVYRNGLRQTKTVDYTESSGKVRFTDGTTDPSLEDDSVLAVCR